ncbi:hypothetical protein LTR36_000367 [Oleoguttula mirabilis]|uniref:Uncharacterized protein n=1 Tax=Oleoguttula mirabilis TaxID=1507867 RepID=A0AAV9K022_9PEZI|nr:hypothetical protein LTR36_000367 [Oleoguttula mirabilis]
MVCVNCGGDCPRRGKWHLSRFCRDQRRPAAAPAAVPTFITNTQPGGTVNHFNLAGMNADEAWQLGANLGAVIGDGLVASQPQAIGEAPVLQRNLQYHGPKSLMSGGLSEQGQSETGKSEAERERSKEKKKKQKAKKFKLAVDAEIARRESEQQRSLPSFESLDAASESES